MKRAFAVFLALIILSGCATKTPTETPEPGIAENTATQVQEQEPMPDPHPAEEEEKTLYFFVSGVMLGAYENRCFVTTGDREFYYEEFLSQPKYSRYSQSGFITDAAQARIDKVPSLSNDTDMVLNTFSSSREDYLGEEYDWVNVYDLPVQFPHEEYFIKYGEYNGYINFGEKPDEYELVTNAGHDLLPRPVRKEAPTQRDTELVEKILAERDMPGCTAYIEQVFICDLEGDGTTERIFAAYERFHDDFKPQAGGGNYSMLVIVRGDAPECVHIETLPFEEEAIEKFASGEYEAMDLYFETYLNCVTPIGIYDLNGDGVFELCAEHGSWEAVDYLGFAMDENGKYIQVMKRECGT